MEITNQAMLREMGGPFTATKQIGYAASYLYVSMSIYGNGYNMADIIFNNSAGQMIPASPIHLDMQDTTAKNLEFSSGHMKLTVKHIELIGPTPSTTGSISLNCTFTDIKGEGEKNYNGILAEWDAEGKLM